MAMAKKSDLEYCERDYKNKHYWESIGITETDRIVPHQFFKCTQCGKCKREQLVYVKGGYPPY
jgi:hypothetical protein